MKSNGMSFSPMRCVFTAAFFTFSASVLGAAPYTVSGPENAKPHERTAMEELSAYLGKRVAGTLRIGGQEGIVFRVGDTELAKRNGLLSSQLPEEKWVIRSFGNEVLLNGGGPRGALFAVYHFLEDYCGVRWWSEFEEDVPAPGALELNALDAQGKPAFAFRDIYREQVGSDAARFERRTRLNARGGAKFGGAFTFGPPNFCHTFDDYLNADKYMKDHPEWFSLHKGKRVGGQRQGQLCLTNPEVREKVLERMLAYIQQGNAEAEKNGVEPPRIYDLSHNDNQSYCECDRCKEAAEKYGLSGVNLNFVNAVAGAIAKKYPNVLLCTWAYQYTQDVPKGGVRAADNVIVRLCDTDSNQISSIAEPDNRAYYDRVVAWSKVTKHLFVWDYAITFSKGLTGLPFPSEFHYGDLFRHYRDNHVSGIFWEHEHPYLTDLWELKFFLERKLMEDPDLDCNRLIEQFMREYYGPAGQHILAYRKYLDRIRREKKAFVSWFTQLSAFDYIDDENVAACNRMLDAAEAAVAGNDRLLARARHARQGLDRLICLRSCPVILHDPAQKGIVVKKVPGFDAVKARLTTDWPKWIRPYPNSENLIKVEMDRLAKAWCSVVSPLPVPERFQNNRYYDFPAFFLSSHGKPGQEILVDDPESPVGRAMRTSADMSHYFKLPFAGGVYDEKTKRNQGSGECAEVQGDGYRWYHICKAKFTPTSYLWLTRAWTTQVRTGNYRELSGKEMDVWASVKFTGPMFRPGATGKSYIWIDRVLLVLP